MATQQSARITLRDTKGAPIPVGTRATHEPGGNVFTIGYDGLTFLPEIAERNTLIVRNGLQECRVEFTLADRDPASGIVPPLTCR